MILSRTSQYAIQALIHLAMQPPGQPVLARAVASHLSVPPAYLAKILQTLTRGGLVRSFRGRSGGFCLKEGADKTTILAIMALIEGPGLSESCVLGLKACEDDNPCPMHRRWKPLKQRLLDLLQDQTLDVLAMAVRGGKYRIVDLPLRLLSA
jgi:Rrf2 family protein